MSAARWYGVSVSYLSLLHLNEMDVQPTLLKMANGVQY